jgi:hypothetical protein
MQPACPLFQPQVAEVVDPVGSPLLPCHTQASNPLDMTKLFFFTVVRCGLFHKTNAAYVNIDDQMGGQWTAKNRVKAKKRGWSTKNRTNVKNNGCKPSKKSFKMTLSPFFKKTINFPLNLSPPKRKGEIFNLLKSLKQEIKLSEKIRRSSNMPSKSILCRFKMAAIK